MLQRCASACMLHSLLLLDDDVACTLPCLRATAPYFTLLLYPPPLPCLLGLPPFMPLSPRSGLGLSTQPGTPTFHSFVLTLMTGARAYAHCFTCWEPIARDDALALWQLVRKDIEGPKYPAAENDSSAPAFRWWCYFFDSPPPPLYGRCTVPLLRTRWEVGWQEAWGEKGGKTGRGREGEAKSCAAL